MLQLMIEAVALSQSRQKRKWRPHFDIEEPLTPSHLLTGHRLLTQPDLTNHKRDPTFGDTDPKKDLTQRIQHLAQTLEYFWRRWRAE